MLLLVFSSILPKMHDVNNYLLIALCYADDNENAKDVGVVFAKQRRVRFSNYFFLLETGGGNRKSNSGFARSTQVMPVNQSCTDTANDTHQKQ